MGRIEGLERGTESLLKICSRKLVGGEVSELSDHEKQQITEYNDGMANNGLRTLAFAYREDASRPAGVDEQEFLEDLIYVALIGFIDPPAHGVKRR